MPTSNSSEEGGGAAQTDAGAVHHDTPSGTPRSPLLALVALLKWPGAAAVMAGVACFPMAIWFPGPWAVISLLLVMGGCVLLVAALRAQRALMPEEDEPEGGTEAG